MIPCLSSRCLARPLLLSCILAIASPGVTRAGAQQAGDVPALRIGAASGQVRIDGRLDESFWSQVDSIADLTQIEPVERSAPSGRTVVRVIATSDAIVVGIRADDPEPEPARPRYLN